MHIIPALAYGDAFISDDDPLRVQAGEVCRVTGRDVAIAATLSEARLKLV